MWKHFKESKIRSRQFSFIWLPTGNTETAWSVTARGNVTNILALAGYPLIFNSGEVKANQLNSDFILEASGIKAKFGISRSKWTILSEAKWN